MKTYKQFTEEVENLDEIWGALARVVQMGAKGAKFGAKARGAAGAAKATGTASKAAKASNTTSRATQAGNAVAKGSKMSGNPRLKGKPPTGRPPITSKPDGPKKFADPNMRRKMGKGIRNFAGRKAGDIGNWAKDQAKKGIRAALTPEVGTASTTTGDGAPDVVVK